MGKNLFVVDPVLDSQALLRHFLEQLATTENIACDIYKEIAIESVTQQFFPFYFLKSEYRCDWTAMACFTYLKKETVYKERYDADLKRYVKKPETDFVQKVRKEPKSGSRHINCQGLVIGSDSLKRLIPAGFDTLAISLLSDFQAQQDAKYHTYKPYQPDPREITEKSGKHFYRGLELDLSFSPQLRDDNILKLSKSAADRVLPEIERSIGGNYYEDLHTEGTTLSQSVARVCIPVQVIRYRYKGQTYVALTDMLSYRDTMPMIFPCDAELAQTKEAMKQENVQSATLPAPFWLGIMGMLVGLVLLIAATMAMDGDVYGFWAVGIWLLSLVLIIIGALIRRSRITAFQKSVQAAKTKLSDPRKAALYDSYRLFFAELEDCTDLKKANQAAATVSIGVEQIQPQLSCYHAIGHIEDSTVLSREEQQIRQLEEEIAALKKKRTLPVILMTVFGILLIPLFVGTILLGNVNAKVNQKEAELKKLRENWIQS